MRSFRRRDGGRGRTDGGAATGSARSPDELACDDAPSLHPVARHEAVRHIGIRTSEGLCDGEVVRSEHEHGPFDRPRFVGVRSGQNEITAFVSFFDQAKMLLAQGLSAFGVIGDDFVKDEPSHATDFTDRVHQAMANWMVLTAAVTKGAFDIPALHRPSAGDGACLDGPEAGKLVFNPSRIHYYGPSLAGILGATLGAVNPDLGRVALNVTGAGFTHMMPRAAPFAPLFLIMHAVFGSSLSDQVFAAALQSGLDRIDPMTYAPNLLAKKLSGSPEDRRVLLQVGLGDSAVPPLGAFLHARSLGLSQTSPAPLPVFGVPEAKAETLTSAMTLYDFGLDANNPDPIPNPSNKIHDGLRKSDEATSQIDAFLAQESKVIHPCPEIGRAHV